MGAWKTYYAANKGMDDEAFESGWGRARAEALKAAGMAAPFS